MGGMSSGTFKLDPDGQGVFEGTVSLENNGASPWYVTHLTK
jgi:hypothetical protein